jgi:uncharacterized membrane protein
LDFRNYQVLFLTVVAVAALLVASPALSRLLVYPRTEFFTELWILGPNHMAEGYPYNVLRDQNYSIFLGVGNQLGKLAYYSIAVKFRNQTQPTADSFNRTYSSLPALHNISAFVPDQQVLEVPLTLSFDYSYNDSLSRVEFFSLTLNGLALNLTGYATTWDSGRSEFMGNLFFEAWIYNSTISSFQYHERFVSLRLNMTG